MQTIKTTNIPASKGISEENSKAFESKQDFLGKTVTIKKTQ